MTMPWYTGFGLGLGLGLGVCGLVNIPDLDERNVEVVVGRIVEAAGPVVERFVVKCFQAQQPQLAVRRRVVGHRSTCSHLSRTTQAFHRSALHPETALTAARSTMINQSMNLSMMIKLFQFASTVSTGRYQCIPSKQCLKIFDCPICLLRLYRDCRPQYVALLSHAVATPPAAEATCALLRRHPPFVGSPAHFARRRRGVATGVRAAPGGTC